MTKKAAGKPLAWHTERRRIADLVPWEHNPRKLGEKEAKDLQRSLERLNVIDIPAIDTDGRIVGGHQRCAVLVALGRGNEEIDVRVPNRKLTEDEYLEANLRLNKNVGSWDFGLLANFNEDLLQNVGFSGKELRRAFGLDGRDDRFDASQAYAGATGEGIEPGDVFALGDHRLICGDATQELPYQALLGKKTQADLVVTDPPYNVDYEGKGKKTRTKIANDAMGYQAFQDMLAAAFRNLHGFTKDKAPLYTCYASRTHREFENALNQAGWEVRNQIIWVKTVASMGWGDYRWKHEPILYAKKQGSTAPFYGDRSEVTEWREYQNDQELLEAVQKMLEKDEAGGSTVWRIARDRDYDHPTQKPVQLYRIALENSSLREGILLDPFAGSGTAAIAAEQTNRLARMIELEPRWCEVILKRWERLGGRTKKT